MYAMMAADQRADTLRTVRLENENAALRYETRKQEVALQDALARCDRQREWIQRVQPEYEHLKLEVEGARKCIASKGKYCNEVHAMLLVAWDRLREDGGYRGNWHEFNQMLRDTVKAAAEKHEEAEALARSAARARASARAAKQVSAA